MHIQHEHKYFQTSITEAYLQKVHVCYSGEGTAQRENRPESNMITEATHHQLGHNGPSAQLVRGIGRTAKRCRQGPNEEACY